MAGIPDTPYSVSCSSPDSLAISRPPAHRATRTQHADSLESPQRRVGAAQRRQAGIQRRAAVAKSFGQRITPPFKPCLGAAFPPAARMSASLRQRLP